LSFEPWIFRNGGQPFRDDNRRIFVAKTSCFLRKQLSSPEHH